MQAPIEVAPNSSPLRTYQLTRALELFRSFDESGYLKLSTKPIVDCLWYSPEFNNEVRRIQKELGIDPTDGDAEALIEKTIALGIGVGIIVSRVATYDNGDNEMLTLLREIAGVPVAQ